MLHSRRVFIHTYERRSYIVPLTIATRMQLNVNYKKILYIFFFSSNNIEFHKF